MTATTPRTFWKNGWLWAAVFGVTFLYFATSPYHRGLNNPNEMVRVYMSHALASRGEFAIDREVQTWGPVDDKAIRDGRLYSSKAPLHSLLGAPVLWTLDDVFRAERMPEAKRRLTLCLRRLAAVPFGLALALWLMGMARVRLRELEVSDSVALAVGLAFALGTMIFPYALLFAGHQVAALCAGGTHLLAFSLARTASKHRQDRLTILMGALGALSPFAEYPAALVALPALGASLGLCSGWKAVGRRVGLLSLAGGPLFLAGLWVHQRLWGGPLRTGYAFLENPAYADLHGAGFFGVGWPRWEAAVGALFSSETGLFFFSPILLLGLVGLAIPARRKPHESMGLAALEPKPLQVFHPPRPLRYAGWMALALSLLFIAGHRGWRGGWTLGPRYIIAVVPVLAVWSLEAFAWPKLRPYILGTGALSVVLTGFAAALYPHLSDVYSHPLRSFVWPSYLRGEMTYGLAYDLGLTGNAANLVHVLPLSAAVGWLVWAALRDGRSSSVGVHRWLGAILVPVLTLILIAVWPETHPNEAARENQRLWQFWEPQKQNNRAGATYPLSPADSGAEFMMSNVGSSPAETPGFVCGWLGGGGAFFTHSAS
jgi:hypothetical protein